MRVCELECEFKVYKFYFVMVYSKFFGIRMREWDVWENNYDKLVLVINEERGLCCLVEFWN